MTSRLLGEERRCKCNVGWWQHAVSDYVQEGQVFESSRQSGKAGDGSRRWRGVNCGFSFVQSTLLKEDEETVEINNTCNRWAIEVFRD